MNQCWFVGEANKWQWCIGDSFSGRHEESKQSKERRKEGKTGKGRLRRCAMIYVSFFLLSSGFCLGSSSMFSLLASYEEEGGGGENRGGGGRRRFPTIIIVLEQISQPTSEGRHSSN